MPVVYIVNGAISYNCFPTIMQLFVVKNAFISRHHVAQLVYWVPRIHSYLKITFKLYSANDTTIDVIAAWVAYKIRVSPYYHIFKPRKAETS